ncbi:HAD-IA family hydrolase [Chelatococcus sp. SYSU_G07232]|uniref:HAD-IA family hydrolase n=1 Tax=Chelatococcus albus TaxID=3047466 RepID=A0ABT7AFG1_9HYPH|nr:HAD-IA family hydrolase [Chelatococcus sp. SYSU_G07232]MDJ1157840.1 HAD-IA family hydrolase [Chelatococcus sp. SYSU_G07232]
MPLIIFDCDGVLIDSEPLACAVDAEVLTAHGIPITPAEINSRFVGKSYRDQIRTLEAEHSVTLPADIEARVWAVLAERFRAELAPIPGVAQALEALSHPRCVASSSSLARLALTLEVTGLAPHFDGAVFGAEQVEHGKPAPDLFLFAARRMDHAPGDCIVVEDSPSGVRTGVAAGMPVIGFIGRGHSTPGHAERLMAAGATTVIPSMSALPAAIALLTAGGPAST